MTFGVGKEEKEGTEAGTVAVEEDHIVVEEIATLTDALHDVHLLLVKIEQNLLTLALCLLDATTITAPPTSADAAGLGRHHSPVQGRVRARLPEDALAHAPPHALQSADDIGPLTPPAVRLQDINSVQTPREPLVLPQERKTFAHTHPGVHVRASVTDNIRLLCQEAGHVLGLDLRRNADEGGAATRLVGAHPHPRKLLVVCHVHLDEDAPAQLLPQMPLDLTGAIEEHLEDLTDLKVQVDQQALNDA